MKYVPITIALLAATIAAATPRTASAQLRAATTGARELAETLVRQGGSRAARELAEVGGETAVREMLETAAREGGEELVQKSTKYALAHGPLAVGALRAAPARMVGALDGLPAPLVRPALHAAAREPQVVTRIVTEFGGEGLEVVARHPGVGTRLVTTCGADGGRAGRNLTTDQAVSLTRHADDIAQLPPAQRSAVLDKIARSPGVVLDFLEKHPRVLLTAGGAATVVALKDELAGTTEIVTGPDGKPVAVAKPGLIERLVVHERSPLRTGLNVVVIILACAVAAWALIRLWGTWRVQRLRYLHEAGSLATKDRGGNRGN